ncbi:MAG: hypothetical protein R3240_09640, partial [Gammaproteobacteria bacterium]|nr:hypothetical protein [Gammaproteobacteria bacterium]
MLAMRSPKGGNPFFSFFALINLCFLSLFITACGENIPVAKDYHASASWSEDNKTLSIYGTTVASKETVQIHDAVTGKLLGEAAVDARGNWEASAGTPACELHVEMPSGTSTIPVKNAPATCATEGLT